MRLGLCSEYRTRSGSERGALQLYRIRIQEQRSCCRKVFRVTMFASSLKQRSLKPERLDTGDYTPAEYAKWHREMRLLHGFFGEMRALRGSLLKELRNDDAERVSILDVGAGSGRLLGAIRQWSGNKKTFLVGAELSADAALLIKHNSINGEIQAIQSDALELPFADDSFDYVISTLFLHHLTDDQCVTLLGEIGRIARRKF